jgi:hypothetical protein
MDSLTIFYLMVALVFLMGGEMLVALWTIWRLAKKISEIKKQEIHQKETLIKKEEEILEQSREKARRIIEEAMISASRIEKNAKINQEELEKIIRGRLEEVADRVMQSYQNQLEKAKNKDIEIYNNISKGIEKDLSKHTESLKNILAKQTIDSQQIVNQKLEKAYQSMIGEVEQYRQIRLSKVEEQMLEIIRKVSEDVLGKAISLVDHQQLIINSLEKAKKENIFK